MVVLIRLDDWRVPDGGNYATALFSRVVAGSCGFSSDQLGSPSEGRTIRCCIPIEKSATTPPHLKLLQRSPVGLFTNYWMRLSSLSCFLPIMSTYNGVCVSFLQCERRLHPIFCHRLAPNDRPDRFETISSTICCNCRCSRDLTCFRRYLFFATDLERLEPASRQMTPFNQIDVKDISYGKFSTRFPPLIPLWYRTFR